MPILDGTEKYIFTPYDAHERTLRRHHSHSLKDGYQTLPDYKPEEHGGAAVAEGIAAETPSKPESETIFDCLKRRFFR